MGKDLHLYTPNPDTHSFVCQDAWLTRYLQKTEICKNRFSSLTRLFEEIEKNCFNKVCSLSNVE